MSLNERETKLLNDLIIKESQPLTNEDLVIMDRNIDSLYEYQEAFKSLMIWNRFSEQLSTLAEDNAKLIREIRRLRAPPNPVKTPAKD